MAALKTKRIVAFLFAALLSGCSSGTFKSLRDSSALRQQLMDKYHEKDISISVANTRFMNIIFVNSPLNKKDRTQRHERARETIDFVKSHYAEIAKIQSIWIGFVQSERRYLVVHYSYPVDGFVFDKNGAELSASYESGDPSRPAANFSASRNETDVSISRIQLEGNIDHGLAMVPHFTVPGNIKDSEAAAAAPKIVVLDFASYADQKVFSKDARLIISGDDKIIFSGTATLLTPGSQESSTNTGAQFLRADVPFPQFFQLTRARQMVVTLGPKRFALTSTAAQSLRDMCDYVQAPEGASK